MIFITAKSFRELVRYLFTVPHFWDSESAKILGSQRQRGRVNENPKEFMKSTQALRVIKNIQAPINGNCRGAKQDLTNQEQTTPLPKRRKTTKHKALGLY